MVPIVETPGASGTAAPVHAAPDLAGPTLRWRDEHDTQRFAAQLATRPAIACATLELQGELGVGKTSLARHLLRALGVSGRVKSPSYAVVEPYQVANPFAPTGAVLNIWHFDFYRFDDPQEWQDAGLRELFAADGLKLSEWPEKAGAWLPPADLCIRIEAGPDTVRRVWLRAQTDCGRQLLP